jgi:hypothetical protein
MADCSICTEVFTDTTRKPVTCFCLFKSCMACTKHYLLDNCYKGPHCMSCKKVWDSDFMKANFSSSFLKGKYRQKREDILFEEEKVFLPPLLEEARYIMTLEKIKRKMERGKELLVENENNEDQMVREQRRKREHINAKILILRDEMAKIHTLYRNIPLGEKKTFLMKCVVDDCRGFLSSKYKCELCSVDVCKDCHLVIEKDDNHKCKEEDVATVVELQKTTRPCPKCQIRISKVDGCDQMFCIQCHTPFSWKTGMIETGPIHNPEYFQLLAKGGIVDVRHRQHQGGCGPIPDYYTISQNIKKSYIERKVEDKLMEYYRQMVHHRHVTLERFIVQDDNKDRLKYLSGKYDEKTFKQKVYVASESRLRKREERQIIDSFVSTGEEMFRGIVRGEDPYSICYQLEQLTAITHEAIIRLSKNYEFAGFVKPNDIIRESK